MPLLPPSRMFRFRALFSGRFLALLAFTITPDALLAAKWPALDPADLAARTPSVDPEAGAEILLREVELDDSDPEVTALEYFLRIKIFSERSLADFSKIEIFHGRNERISNIMARTHRPDGTVVELTRKDIFERDVIKTGDYRQKVKSFAPPGLQVGAILEYRYTRIFEDSTGGMPLSFQADHPARLVRLRVRLYEHPRLTGRMLYFGYQNPPTKPDPNGYYNMELRDVPARVKEPWRPPAIQTEPTIFVYYSDNRETDPAKVWTKRATELFSASESETKPGKGARAAVEGLLAAGDSDEEKLRKIYDYCRSRIKHRYLDSSGFTEEQRAKFKPNDSPETTLKLGHGSSRDINKVFIAMARAAGFDARYAWANDCSSILFDPRMIERFALPDLVAAVKFGADWKYYDPARIYLPPGMLSWENNGTVALVADKTAGKIGPTPISPAEASRRVRAAKLTLQADGTLEGTVNIVYTGLWEASEKDDFDGKSPRALADLIAGAFREDQPLAEVTDVKVLNASDPLNRLQVSYHLRIPEYAERTGSRIFFQPGIFFKGTKALFEAAARKYDVQMRYRYMSEDQITITLPENFELEAPSAPAAIDLPPIAHYKVQIGIVKEERKLQYHRTFSSSIIHVPVKHYPSIKTLFDTVHSRDTHALTLKRTVAAAAPASGGAR